MKTLSFLVNLNSLSSSWTNAVPETTIQCSFLWLWYCKEIDCPGFFVEPTIAEVQNEWDIVQEETFAPILYLLKYKDIFEAINLQNDVKQGLSSAIFTENVKNS